MTELKWKLKLSTTPILKDSEQIEGFYFETSGDKTHVNINFCTSSFDETLPTRLDEYEYAEETLTREYIDKLRSLFLKRLIHRKAFQPIEITIEEGPLLTNREELKGSDLLKGRSCFSSFDTSFNILDVNDTLNDALVFWSSKFQNSSMGLQEDVLRVSDWFEKSKREKDTIQSFILCWVGFNGLYNLFCDTIYPNSKINEADKFERMLDSLIDVGDKEGIINNSMKPIAELSTYNVLSENGKTDWSDTLKVELNKQNRDANTIIKTMVRCVYGIRKQVFHEAPRPTDVKRRAQVAKQILEPIAYSCLKCITNMS